MTVFILYGEILTNNNNPFFSLKEAVAACIGGCLLFLEGPVEQHKTAPLGATKFQKVNDQLNKV